jgi:hypothetical protein
VVSLPRHLNASIVRLKRITPGLVLAEVLFQIPEAIHGQGYSAYKTLGKGAF